VGQDQFYTFAEFVKDKGDVALWDMEWNLLSRSDHAHADAKVRLVAFSPCGSWLLTSAEHGGGFLGTTFLA